MNNVYIPFGDSCLQQAARLLLKYHLQNGLLDLSKIQIVLPGSRAKRRLIELLCEITDAENVILVPPVIFTAGGFRDNFVANLHEDSIASEVEELLAWNNAIKANPAALENICSTESQFDPFDMARTIRTIYRELAGESLSFVDVAKQEFDDFNESDRWQSLAAIFDSYLAELKSQKLTDIYLKVNTALAKFKHQPELLDEAIGDLQTLYVIGVVDSFGQFENLLAFFVDKLVVISHGPSHYFNQFGLLKKSPELVFDDCAPDLSQIHFSDSPTLQALNCVDFISGCTEYSHSDIVISVPDEEVVNPLLAELDCAGINGQNALGGKFQETDLGTLIKAITNYLQRSNFASLWALINHPLMERYLSVNLENIAETTSKLRNRAARHLVDFICPDSKKMLVADAPQIEVLLSNLTAILDLLAGQRPFAQWPPVINKFLEKIYQAKVEERKIDDKHFDVVDKWVELSDNIVQAHIQDHEEINLMKALKRFSRLLKGIRIKDSVKPNTIDMIGWLEMPLEDAPVIILTGMNEGKVPQAVVSDQFLPNKLRTNLAINNNQSRFNRDLYFYQSIVSSCEKCLISAGRSSNTGDPLKPGRIILEMPAHGQAFLINNFYDQNNDFEFDALELNQEISKKTIRYSESTILNFLSTLYHALIKRLDQYWLAETSPASLELLQSENALYLEMPDKAQTFSAQSLYKKNKKRFKLTQSYLPSDIEIDLPQKPKHYSASKLKTYLTCPYKYYLEQRNIRAPEELSSELDALKYGNLIHNVLEQFGKSEYKNCSDAKLIYKTLINIMQNKVLLLYGSTIHPALELQLNGIQSRLYKFAEIQAANASDGWKIMEVEHEMYYDLTDPLDANFSAKIKGYIDRIDLRNNQVRLLDYKTGSNVLAPKKAHYLEKKGQWLDFQLPLYCKYISDLKEYRQKEIEVGYFSLPQKINHVKIDLWDDFDENMRLIALEQVRNIIRKIESRDPHKFKRIDDFKACLICDFKQICQRG